MTQKNKHGLTRYIRSDIKKQVRQRCGYGCVICGGIFCEYDHFDPTFAEAESHNAVGITLLCLTHHGEVTSGLLSRETVQKANSSPYCLEKSNPHYMFKDLQFPFEIALGGIVFISPDGVLLQADGEDLLSIRNSNKNEPPLINARFKSANGNELRIVDNEVIISKGHWDIQTKKSEIIIKSDEKEVFLHLKFTPPKRLQILKIKNVYNGHTIDTEFGGKLFVECASGAKIDFVSGYIAAGGKLKLDRNKGITFYRGCLVMGSKFPNAFKGDLDYFLNEVKKLEDAGQFHD